MNQSGQQAGKQMRVGGKKENQEPLQDGGVDFIRRSKRAVGKRERSSLVWGGRALRKDGGKDGGGGPFLDNNVR